MSGSSRARKRYITSRQVQKLSWSGPRRSASPAIARWNAWEWTFGTPGRTAASRISSGSGVAPSVTPRITPSSTVTRTREVHPCGSSAVSKKNPPIIGTRRVSACCGSD